MPYQAWLPPLQISQVDFIIKFPVSTGQLFSKHWIVLTLELYISIVNRPGVAGAVLQPPS